MEVVRSGGGGRKRRRRRRLGPVAGQPPCVAVGDGAPGGP